MISCDKIGITKNCGKILKGKIDPDEPSGHLENVFIKTEESDIKFTFTAYVERNTYGRMKHLICELFPSIVSMKLLCDVLRNSEIHQEISYYIVLRQSFSRRKGLQVSNGNVVIFKVIEIVNKFRCSNSYFTADFTYLMERSIYV